ncbi:hypothetical protein LCGC14_0803910 [marine sediment metagenome]|uniref:Ubiquitin-activating enzyme E1 FCCH domain-containing protein n=1 Tax=marine sediment metagenome TaxID=412755 RepID=A0A0F9PTF8_9ZZZZ
MSTPIHGQISGSYVSDGNARVLDLRFEPTYFKLMNQTNFNTMGVTPVVKRAWWFSTLASDEAFTVQNTTAALTDESVFITTGGIRPINTATDPVEAAVVGTAITAASPPVVTMTAHGYSIGDVVRLYSTTAMLQIAGMEFTITDVPDANSFEIDYLDASGFAAAATAVTARRLPFDPQDFAPKNRFVTNITAAANAVITLSVDHGYQVDEIITVRCTPDFGMSEIDQLQGQITAIDTTLNTVTTDIDSSAFTAFAFPTSAVAAAGVTFPQTVPVGDFGNVLTGSIDNQAIIGLRLGLSVVGVADDVVHWIATTGLVQV